MSDQFGNSTLTPPAAPPPPDVDIRPTWGVIEVDHKLMHSTGLHAFQVMRVTDHEAAVDALLAKFAEAERRWVASAADAGFVLSTGRSQA